MGACEEVCMSRRLLYLFILQSTFSISSPSNFRLITSGDEWQENGLQLSTTIVGGCNLSFYLILVLISLRHTSLSLLSSASMLFLMMKLWTRLILPLTFIFLSYFSKSFCFLCWSRIEDSERAELREARVIDFLEILEFEEEMSVVVGSLLSFYLVVLTSSICVSLSC